MGCSEDGLVTQTNLYIVYIVPGFEIMLARISKLHIFIT